MKINSFQIILVGVFAVAALIGLFVFSTYTNHGGTGAVGTVVIWGTLPASDVNAGLAAATQTNPALKNVSYVEKDPATLANDLAAAIATGASPDLVLASQEDLLALQKFLVPIPVSSVSIAAFDKTYAGEGSLFILPQNQGYYGLPILIDPMVLFYNRNILASSGIAQAPATWEALTGLVPGVAELTPSRQITRGLIALGTYANVHDARGILSTLFLQTGVPITERSSSTGLLSPDLGLSSTDSGTLAPGPAAVRFYTQFSDPSKVSYTWNASLPDSQQAFQNGNLALYLGFVSEARFFTAANPNLDFDVAPIPQPGTATLKTTYGLMYALMISRGSQNQAGALAAAAALAQTGIEQALASATGLAPATRAALAAPPASDPVADISYLSALYASGWLSPDPASTDSVFSTMINSVISGSVELDQALANAESSIGSLLSATSS